MGTNFLQPFSSKSPPSSSTLIFTKITHRQSQIFLPCRKQPLRISPIITNSTNTSSNTNSNNTSGDSAQPPPVPTNPVEIKFRRRSSRRRSRQQAEDGAAGSGQAMKAKVEEPPKKWEDMNITEKAIELYVGEKGLLFWLNKFAYASIFIVIGGWILFRFVGPSLNLYQLDTPPLSPSSVFKG